MNDAAIIDKFNKERNEALLSLNEGKIRSMVKKWNGIDMPQGEIFWGAVHKAITGNTMLPMDFRRQSKRWLDAHGLKSFDDGDL